MFSKTKSYRQALLEDLTDPEVAASYLTEAKKHSPAMFRKALRNVAQSHQMAHVARSAKITRESLYKVTSVAGNPNHDTFESILTALGLDYIIVPKEAVAATAPVPSSERKHIKRYGEAKKSGRISLDRIVLGSGSGKTALLMQAGLGWGHQSYTSPPAVVAFGQDINAFANAEQRVPARVPIEQQAVTINHLVYARMKHGVGEDYTANQGNSL